MPYSPLSLAAVLASILVVVVAAHHHDQSPFCPHGCRCTSGPKWHARHHWGRLLAQYRMRRLLYGPGGGGQRYRVYKDASLPDGREMTCVGLTRMPETLPTDVKKVTFYGSSKEVYYAIDGLPNDQAVLQRDGAGPEASAQGQQQIFPEGYHQLTSISKFTFVEAAKMKELGIEGNRIKVLHALEFDMLQGLQRLSLRRNRLQLINVRAFVGLEKLQELDLSQNHLPSIPRSALNPMQSLKKLIIAENHLYKIDEKQFVELPKLEHVDLSYNLLKDLYDASFYRNLKLIFLSLAHNDLSFIRPDWFGTLKGLVKLDLKGNRISALPPGIFYGLIHLTLLNLDKNSITSITKESFESLDSLQILRLQHNNISHIENKTFEGLSTLSELRLDFNFIKTVDKEAFHGLLKLRILSISGNRIVELGLFHLAPLKSIEQLDLSYNKIKHVRTRNFYGLLYLKDLRLNHNDIKVIADEAFAAEMTNSYSKLTWLYLNSNRLFSISSNMFKGMPYIKFINLGQNHIERIAPRALAALPRLHTFIMNDNDMETIQAATFRGQRLLRHLNFENNKIMGLERHSLLGLVNLEDISFYSNALNYISAHMFKNTPRLTSLNLQRNLLSSFDMITLRNTPKLRQLDLSKNRIFHLVSSPVQHRHLSFLGLNDNELDTLPENITSTMALGGAMHLYDNPWACDCQLAWLADVGSQGHVRLAHEGKITCKRPSKLSGSKIMVLMPTDFICPLPEEEVVTKPPEEATTSEYINHVQNVIYNKPKPVKGKPAYPKHLSSFPEKPKYSEEASPLTAVYTEKSSYTKETSWKPAYTKEPVSNIRELTYESSSTISEAPYWKETSHQTKPPTKSDHTEYQTSIPIKSTTLSTSIMTTDTSTELASTKPTTQEINDHSSPIATSEENFKYSSAPTLSIAKSSTSPTSTTTSLISTATSPNSITTNPRRPTPASLTSSDITTSSSDTTPTSHDATTPTSSNATPTPFDTTPAPSDTTPAPSDTTTSSISNSSDRDISSEFTTERMEWTTMDVNNETSLPSEFQVSADAPQGISAFSCYFLPDELKKNTRAYIKSQKYQTESLVTRLYNRNDKMICIGVAVSAQWILLPTKCMRDLTKTMKIAHGSNTEKKEKIGIVQTQTSRDSQDMSMIQISPVSPTKYPCLLSNEGIIQAQRHHITAIVVTTWNALPNKKLKAYPVKLDNNCGYSDKLCFKVNPKRFSIVDFQVHNVPIFVKIGAVKWALLGLTEYQSGMNDSVKLVVRPVHGIQEWVENLIG